MPGQHSSGVWFNKRAVSFIEMAFPHAFRAMPEGWEIEAAGPGRMEVRLLHGGQQRFDVVPEDTLRASGDEMYLVLAGRTPRPPKT